MTINVLNHPVHLFKIEDKEDRAVIESEDENGPHRVWVPMWKIDKSNPEKYESGTVGGSLIEQIVACQKCAVDSFPEGFVTYLFERGEEFGVASIDRRHFQKISLEKIE